MGVVPLSNFKIANVLPIYKNGSPTSTCNYRPISLLSVFITANNTKSSANIISCGVPQGSVLGPILFVLYVNDFHHSSNLFDFHLFADDANLFYRHKNINILQSDVNTELNSINVWLCANKLSLNVEKSNFVLFHPSQRKIVSCSILGYFGKPFIVYKHLCKRLGLTDLVPKSLSEAENFANLKEAVLKHTPNFTQQKLESQLQSVVTSPRHDSDHLAKLVRDKVYHLFATAVLLMDYLFAISVTKLVTLLAVKEELRHIDISSPPVYRSHSVINLLMHYQSVINFDTSKLQL
ncbi:Hypothetical predicted protein, partial [Paramuricea clavata]